jgi:quinol monooxygenase YgiN
MIVVRFKVTCQPGRAEHALAVFEPVIGPSRALDGVVSFDIARDITDPDSIIAIEVFEDRAALERQQALPEVATVMSVLPQILAGPPQTAIYQASPSQLHT